MHSHASHGENDHMHGRHSHAKAPPWLLKLGIAFTLTTFILGLIFWRLSGGSAAVLGDALHSLFHAAIFSIALWGNAAGHRRKQARAGLYMGWVIIGTALYIGASGIIRIISPGEILSAYMIVVASIALTSEIIQAILMLSVTYKGTRARKTFLMKIALRDNFIDMFSSIGVLIGGLIILTTGFYRADGIAAIPIALAALYLGAKTIRESRSELKSV